MDGTASVSRPLLTVTADGRRRQSHLESKFSGCLRNDSRSGANTNHDAGLYRKPQFWFPESSRTQSRSVGGDSDASAVPEPSPPPRGTPVPMSQPKSSTEVASLTRRNNLRLPPKSAAGGGRGGSEGDGPAWPH